MQHAPEEHLLVRVAQLGVVLPSDPHLARRSVIVVPPRMTMLLVLLLPLELLLFPLELLLPSRFSRAHLLHQGVELLLFALRLFQSGVLPLPLDPASDRGLRPVGAEGTLGSVLMQLVLFDLLFLVLQGEVLGRRGGHDARGEVEVVFLVVADGLGGRKGLVFFLQRHVGPDQVSGERPLGGFGLELFGEDVVVLLGRLETGLLVVGPVELSSLVQVVHHVVELALFGWVETIGLQFGGVERLGPAAQLHPLFLGQLLLQHQFFFELHGVAGVNLADLFDVVLYGLLRSLGVADRLALAVHGRHGLLLQTGVLLERVDRRGAGPFPRVGDPVARVARTACVF